MGQSSCGCNPCRCRATHSAPPSLPMRTAPPSATERGAIAPPGGVMRLRGLARALVVCCAFMSTACDDDDDEGQACTPGDTRTCFGPGACNGVQVCNSEGSGFGPCGFGSGTGAGGVGAGGIGAGGVGGSGSGGLGGAGGTAGAGGAGGSGGTPSGPVVLASGQDSPIPIAVDTTHIYWAKE